MVLSLSICKLLAVIGEILDTEVPTICSRNVGLSAYIRGWYNNRHKWTLLLQLLNLNPLFQIRSTAYGLDLSQCWRCCARWRQWLQRSDFGSSATTEQEQSLMPLPTGKKATVHWLLATLCLVMIQAAPLDLIVTTIEPNVPQDMYCNQVVLGQCILWLDDEIRDRKNDQVAVKIGTTLDNSDVTTWLYLETHESRKRNSMIESVKDALFVFKVTSANIAKTILTVLIAPLLRLISLLERTSKGSTESTNERFSSGIRGSWSDAGLLNASTITYGNLLDGMPLSTKLTLMNFDINHLVRSPLLLLAFFFYEWTDQYHCPVDLKFLAYVQTMNTAGLAQRYGDHCWSLLFVIINLNV